MKAQILVATAILMALPTVAMAKHPSMWVGPQLKQHAIGDYVFQWCIGETEKRQPQRVRTGYAVYVIKTKGEAPLVNLRSGRETDSNSGILLTPTEALQLGKTLEGFDEIWTSIDDDKKNVEIGDLTLQIVKRKADYNTSISLYHLHGGNFHFSEFSHKKRDDISPTVAKLAEILKTAPKYAELVKKSWPKDLDTPVTATKAKADDEADSEAFNADLF